MYKDKDKQREANRQAQARFKAKGITDKELDDAQGITNQGITGRVLPVIETPTVTGFTKTKFKPERTAQGNIRVSKPGDTDYVPQCETTKAFVEGRDKQPSTAKRGLDIKCFEDLPVGMQARINVMSIIDGKIDKDEKTKRKAKRTAIAIKYQHQFPDRYNSSQTDATLMASIVVAGKPGVEGGP